MKPYNWRIIKMTFYGQAKHTMILLGIHVSSISFTTVTLHSPLWWAQNGLFLWERLIHVMIISSVHHEGYSILNNLLHDGYITFTAFKKTISYHNILYQSLFIILIYIWLFDVNKPTFLGHRIFKIYNYWVYIWK